MSNHSFFSNNNMGAILTPSSMTTNKPKDFEDNDEMGAFLSPSSANNESIATISP
ncbi:MAG: hypothetical protein HUU50_05735 [Candidatus Brocadiae bacterium]|nr:hypothetical protein [Candidatus Brocadiia bacterium]